MCRNWSQNSKWPFSISIGWPNTWKIIPAPLAHRKNGKSLLLTAETRDLQDFVLKHVDELFEKPSELVRMTNNAAGTAR